MEFPVIIVKECLFMPAEKQMFTQLLNRTLFLAYVDISSENYSVNFMWTIWWTHTVRITVFCLAINWKHVFNILQSHAQSFCLQKFKH